MELLKPDAGKILYLLIGFIVLPRVIPMIRAKA
jgi:hypothetical protein